MSKLPSRSTPEQFAAAVTAQAARVLRAAADDNNKVTLKDVRELEPRRGLPASLLDVTADNIAGYFRRSHARKADVDTVLRSIHRSAENGAKKAVGRDGKMTQARAVEHLPKNLVDNYLALRGGRAPAGDYLKGDGIDLPAIARRFNGENESTIGEATVFGAVAPRKNLTRHREIVIETPGRYLLDLDWYEAGSRMVLALESPVKRHLGTFQGTEGHKLINLGRLDAGDRLVFGNVTFWDSRAYGPINSGDRSAYHVRKLGSDAWDVSMDDGVHADGGYNDVHFFVRRAGGEVTPGQLDRTPPGSEPPH